MTPAEKQHVVKALQRIQEQHGHLTAEVTVNEARNPDSPLHPHFDWDDATAAEKHRLEQARALIRSVKIQVTTDERKVSTVCYVRDPDTDHGYVPTLSLKDDTDRAREALMSEVRRAQAAMERARDVADALGMRDDVERMLSELVVMEKMAA